MIGKKARSVTESKPEATFGDLPNGQLGGPCKNGQKKFKDIL